MAIPEHLRNKAGQKPFNGPTPAQTPPQQRTPRPSQPQQRTQGTQQGAARPFGNTTTQRGGAQNRGQNFTPQPERRVANPFRGDIAQATPSMRGNFFPEGKHRVRIDVVKTIASNQKPGVMFYIVECVVLASDQGHVVPGQRRSWVVDLSKKPAYGDIRKFVAICFNTDWQQVDDEICNMTCDADEQPLKGFVLDLVCTQIPLTKTNGVFTKHEWVLVCEPGGEGDDPNVQSESQSASSEDDPPPLDEEDIPF
jgi:hypothetical protein